MRVITREAKQINFEIFVANAGKQFKYCVVHKLKQVWLEFVYPNSDSFLENWHCQWQLWLFNSKA